MVATLTAPTGKVTHKILVVDDSPTERFFLADILARKGYKVITAENGDDLILRIKTEKPSVVIMDVVMPGDSGFKLTRNLSRDPDTQKVPVILCSTKSNETDRIWGLKQGAREYLTKPVQPEELLKKIAGLLS